MKQLYSHQRDAMALLRASLRAGKKRPVLMAPTGFGKTVLASAMVQGALGKNNRVIFCVPRISLIDQTIQSFEDDGITDIGVIQANHVRSNYRAPVQIASVQTLTRRGAIPHADIVVIDECHEWFKFYEKWFADWNAIPFVGMSATPWAKGLGKHYDDLLIAATTQDLINDGFLSDFKVFAPSSPDLKGVHIQAGDYKEDELQQRMDPLQADIVKTWLAKGESRPTFCFAVNRAHARHLEQEFNRHGVRTAYVDCYTPLDERAAVGREFNNGNIQVVCNVGVLTTGIDWDVRCIILARPTKSEILFTQMIGRGLRTAPGKDCCVILDHSDNHRRLGFVTDIMHEILDDGNRSTTEREKKTEEQLPKVCSNCHIVKPAGVHECPACGHKPIRRQNVEVIDGDLREITKGALRKGAHDEKQRLYGELRYIAMKRGYSKGWVAHTYREMLGVWPRQIDTRAIFEPRAEVVAFVQQKIRMFTSRRVER